jgi:hypothetical protein
LYNCLILRELVPAHFLGNNLLALLFCTFLFSSCEAVQRLKLVIKFQARRMRMMSVTAGLLVLSLGLLGQALVPLVQQHEGSGDVTVAPEVEVTKKKKSIG